MRRDLEYLLCLKSNDSLGNKGSVTSYSSAPLQTRQLNLKAECQKTLADSPIPYVPACRMGQMFWQFQAITARQDHMAVLFESGRSWKACQILAFWGASHSSLVIRI